VLSNYEYLLFKRFFLSRKNEGFISIISWFSLIGIAIGVAVLIIVMSVMNGFRDELIDRIVGINGHINIYSINNIINEKEFYLLNKDKNFNELTSNAVIESQGLIISNNNSKGVFLRSMDSESFNNTNNLSNENFSGRIFKNNSNEIIIGNNLARSLNVKINDSIKIAVPKSDKTIFGNIPRFKSMKIVGIFNLGMYEYDSTFVYVPYNVGRSLLTLEKNQFNNIEIFLDDPESVNDYIVKLKDLFNKNNINNLFFLSWKDHNKSFLEALKIERNVMFLILILIILIASLNIISGLVIFVKDKNVDIGILRAIGISKLSLIKIFILIGSSIGIIGTIVGVILGIIFCINIEKIQIFFENTLQLNLFAPEIYYLSNLPARISYFEVLFIAFLAIFLTFISTIYPAIKSSKIDPAKILRNE
tara:strand:+ start:269 stop:1525 length:1257 start_codon:yes stop_codon:yes gene_type:complete